MLAAIRRRSISMDERFKDAPVLAFKIMELFAGS